MKGNPGSRNIWVELGTEFVRRLSYPFMAVVLIFLFGTIGYYVLGGGRWGMLDSAYMTSITLTTVGYGEIFEMGSAGRTFTIILMWSGLLGMLYATAIVTAFVVEMNLGQILRERKMEKEIEKLYYSIGEVAEMFEVSPSLIRYWEKEFNILAPRKNKKGNRLFTKEDIKNLELIYQLVKEKGYTLEGAKNRLQSGKDDIKRNQDIIDRLKKLKSFLESLKEEL